MSVYANVTKFINKLLQTIGYKIVRAESDFSLRSALWRLAQRSIHVKTVIDVGASNGSWSKTLHPFYPQADYFLIEANPTHQDALEKYKRTTNSIDYILAAAGDREGEIFFDSRISLGGVASEISHEGYSRVPMTTIDAQIKERQLQPPFLIKLDTHGFELPILDGAKEALQHTSILVIETYNFQLQPHSLRFHEICAYLEARGFRPIDIVEPLHRPTDGALWQFDLVFARADRPEFSHNTYA